MSLPPRPGAPRNARSPRRHGPVNMMALEEYKETAERHEFLSTQRKDLLDAIENTAPRSRKSIKSRGRNSRRRSTKLTRTSRPRSANSSAADMASCGSPISKTARRAALTWWRRLPARSCRTCCCSPAAKGTYGAGVAGRHLPVHASPFCILDEVDAPLDESNIARFTELVREMSVQTQFILITHSKRTMSIAPCFMADYAGAGCRSWCQCGLGRRKRMSLSEEEARGLDDLERWQIEEIKKA